MQRMSFLGFNAFSLAGCHARVGLLWLDGLSSRTAGCAVINGLDIFHLFLLVSLSDELRIIVTTHQVISCWFILGLRSACRNFLSARKYKVKTFYLKVNDF